MTKGTLFTATIVLMMSGAIYLIAKPKEVQEGLNRNVFNPIRQKKQETTCSKLTNYPFFTA